MQNDYCNSFWEYLRVAIRARPGKKFSKVSMLVHFLLTMTIVISFQNICKWPSARVLGDGKKFSKVSSLLHFICKMTIEIVFENICEWPSARILADSKKFSKLCLLLDLLCKITVKIIFANFDAWRVLHDGPKFSKVSSMVTYVLHWAMRGLLRIFTCDAHT